MKAAAENQPGHNDEHQNHRHDNGHTPSAASTIALNLNVRHRSLLRSRLPSSCHA